MVEATHQHEVDAMAQQRAAIIEGVINAVRASADVGQLQALLTDPEVAALAQTNVGIAALASFVSSDISTKLSAQQVAEIANTLGIAKSKAAEAETAQVTAGGVAGASAAGATVAALPTDAEKAETIKRALEAAGRTPATGGHSMAG